MQSIAFLALTAVSLASVTSAHAQLVFEREPLSLTVDGYANLTGARNSGEDNAPGARRNGARVDAGLRLLGLLTTESGLKLGARVEVIGSKEDALELGERSLLVIGDWGRFEAGKRRGLPNVLSGYAPNAYAFTSAEFGISSGRTLDPGGTLATAFLAPSLASQIDSISSLGFAATFSGDQSGKLIYVSPKRGGWEGGASFSPRAEALGGRFRRLLQAGVVREHYFGEQVLRVGGSYTHAEGAGDIGSGNAFKDLNSLSGGATLVLDNALYLGASFTYDGRSGQQLVAAPASQSNAFGYSASVNYNTGPWTLGTYYQRASAEGDPARVGQDRLRALQFGASYRLSTKVRFYGAYHLYRFHDEGGASDAERFSGGVFLVGTRVAF